MRNRIRTPHAALVLALTTSCLSAPALALEGMVHRVQSGVKTIQSAIDQANDGDEIIVAPGIYREQIDLLGKSIVIRGEAGAEHTLIDGGALPEDSSNRSVVTMRSGEGPDTRLIGLTIAGGSGTALNRRGRERDCGGGLLLIGASPFIERCLILNNEADEGGACFSQDGTPVFKDCWFYLNDSGAGSAEIRCLESRPRIIACGFHGDGIQWEDAGVIDIRDDCGVSGACCVRDDCIMVTMTACVDAGGSWKGENRMCVQGTCPAYCEEDVNGDGRVNMTDVLRVLDAWGMCGGHWPG
ncbi:MAG: hypothetical protein CMJ40_04710 [Phycisphaerae bacterium]|nr:hypothetical protein [Phycisphaerae bacterium]|tara:strand:+ start:3674 stop:4567 length:894 start_codon:yes stop_codon:yes gene_type:complete